MIKKLIAVGALAGMALTFVPASTALANGAASTRNIIIGVGAATYLIIHHNRVVHQREAAQSARTAAAEQQANNATAAYQSEERAYEHQVAVTRDLEREVAFQHSVITRQNTQLADLGVHQTIITTHEAVASTNSKNAHHAAPREVAMVSYGWGTL